MRALYENVSAYAAANPYAAGKGSFGEVYKGYHANPPITSQQRTHHNRHSASINEREKQ